MQAYASMAGRFWGGGDAAESSSGHSSGEDEDAGQTQDSASDSEGSSSRTSGSSSRTSSTSSISGSESDEDEDAKLERKMLRWLIIPEHRPAARPSGRRRRPGAARNRNTVSDADSSATEPVDYTLEALVKEVAQTAQTRGRRGFDRREYARKLAALLPCAQRHGPRVQLYIWSSMVWADFDAAGGALVPMKTQLWSEAFDKVSAMLPLLEESYHELRGLGISETEIFEGQDAGTADPTCHARQQAFVISAAMKLDDELYKALQNSQDAYGTEYQEILSLSPKTLMLLKRMLGFLESTKQDQPLGMVALRFMEHLYYKPDALNKALYESIQDRVGDSEKASWCWPANSKVLMATLSRYVRATGQVRQLHKALLFQAYHLALHDLFHEAHDVLSLCNVQGQADESESDIDMTILYHRVLAQMGLCAFRLGMTQVAYNCLRNLCMHGKARVLLAQGFSHSNLQDGTLALERAQRLRQLPLHMHISLDVLDSVHHLCTMLLEMPSLAMESLDPTNHRMTSRVLRAAIEKHDKLPFTGPPESAQDAIAVAAKALRWGDWQSACNAVEGLKLWDHIDVGCRERGQQVKAEIMRQIKVEALRAYVFSHASIYDAFDVERLVGMFALPAKTVRSVVSKMIAKEEVIAFWDESSRCLLMRHVEPTPLQRLALELADKGAQLHEGSERVAGPLLSGRGLAERGLEGRSAGHADHPGAGRGGQQRFGKVALGFNDVRKGRGRAAAAASPGPPRGTRGWDHARPGAFGAFGGGAGRRARGRGAG